jgi:hypothetical protein
MTLHRKPGSPVIIGPAIIGSSRIGQPVGDPKRRDLLGRVDELAIFRSALSQAEVRRLYEEGEGPAGRSDLEIFARSRAKCLTDSPRSVLLR